MNANEEQEPFLQRRPPYSKTQVNKQGSNWRDGRDFDEQPIDEFLAYSAIHIDELFAITRRMIATFDFGIAPIDGLTVRPDSGGYALTARVKTKSTLLEKLRRMRSTPLMNIQDVVGIRFDCDLTLSQQSEVANSFAETFRQQGAKRVDIKDLRDKPHSGYRAVHLHVYANAGRSEIQIRTALQSRWANIYEKAGDIYGRDIRYLHEGGEIPKNAEKMVQDLHRLSRIIERIEALSDEPRLKQRRMIKKLRKEANGILDSSNHTLELVAEANAAQERRLR